MNQSLAYTDRNSRFMRVESKKDATIMTLMPLKWYPPSQKIYFKYSPTKANALLNARLM